ncbi:MAG: aminopeptidase [Clostridia bacterium]|nr:aminopeptidase [Clostridia bacterium]
MEHKLEQLQAAASTALVDCLATKKGETVLIVIDEPMVELGEVFYEEGRRLGFEMMVIKMSARENHGSEPPKTVAVAMAAADVVFCITSKSLSHTQARKDACAKGARVASMPAVTTQMMERALAVDYQAMAKLSQQLAELLTAGKKVRITSPAGTDLELELAGRRGNADTGLLHEPGAFGNLPAGEAYIAPVEGTARGTLVIDGAISGIGVLDEPLMMEVEHGVVVSTSGKNSKALEEIFAKYGPKARNIAELGIGTNPKAKLTGVVLEDEKVLGTIHIALGNNSNFGGTVQVASHLDGMVTKPTVVIDEKVILEEGVLHSKFEPRISNLE